MSYKQYNVIWEHSNARGSTRLVLLALARYANDDGGSCYPSLNRLAKDAKLNPRQLQRHIAKLVKAGELQILSTGSGRRSSRYQILIGRFRPANSQAMTAPSSLVSDSTRGSTPPTDGGEASGKTLRPGGIAGTAATPPSSNPSIEPAAEPKKEPLVPPTNDKAETDPVKSFLEPYYRERPQYRTAPHHLVQRLLNDVGCDEALIQDVSGRGVSPEVATECIIEMQNQRTPVRNVGAWLRSALTRRGVRFKPVQG